MADDGQRGGPGAGKGPSAGSASDAAAQLRGAWATLQPSRRDFGKVVTEINVSKLVGDGGGVLERAACDSNAYAVLQTSR